MEGVTERNFRAVYPESVRDAFWELVEHSLQAIFQKEQELARRYREIVEASPIGEQMSVYHREPINIAADLSQVGEVTREHIAKYAAMRQSSLQNKLGHSDAAEHSTVRDGRETIEEIGERGGRISENVRRAARETRERTARLAVLARKKSSEAYHRTSEAGTRVASVARNDAADDGELRFEVIAADKVEGTSVYDMTGDKLGTIRNVMIDKLSGEVVYASLAFGGVLGMGQKYHALPWDVLTYNTDLGGYQVEIDRNKLEQGQAATRGEDEEVVLGKDVSERSERVAETGRTEADADDQVENR